MATLGDYRRSRFLTQVELAMLAQLGIATIKRWEDRELDASMWFNVNHVEATLNHTFADGFFVAPKLIDPFTLERMPARTMRRLPVGHCFASFGYYMPEEAEASALRMRRPDLFAKAREYEGQRVILLYRVVTSRYAREELRKGFGVRLEDIRPSSLRPLSDFKPGADDGRHQGQDLRGVQNVDPALEEHKD